MHRLSVPAAFLAVMFAVSAGHAAEPAPTTPNATATSASAPKASAPKASALLDKSGAQVKPDLDLTVYPESIDLTTARDYQSFIAVARRVDDVTLDVTADASWTLADEKIARIDGNQVLPVADGRDRIGLRFSWQPDSDPRQNHSQRREAADQLRKGHCSHHDP